MGRVGFFGPAFGFAFLFFSRCHPERAVFLRCHPEPALGVRDLLSDFAFVGAPACCARQRNARENPAHMPPHNAIPHSPYSFELALSPISNLKSEISNLRRRRFAFASAFSPHAHPPQNPLQHPSQRRHCSGNTSGVIMP
jgi:hypothetical protein